MFHYSVIFTLNFIVIFINIIIIVLFCRHWPFQPTWHSKKTQEATIRAQLISSALHIKSYEYPTCSNLKKAMSHQCHCQPLPSLVLPPEARGGSKNRAMIRRPLLRSANFATCAPGTTPGFSDWWISSWPNWATKKTLTTFHYTGWLIGILTILQWFIKIPI